MRSEPSITLVPLRLQLVSDGLRFPAFSGSVWHGGFGQALARRFPEAFHLLYGGQAETRLHSLRPEPGETYPSGSRLTLELSLFGHAGEHVCACTQAIAQLGESGIDPAGHYRLTHAAVRTPLGDIEYFTAADGFTRPPPTTDFRDWLPARPAPAAIELTLLTPLRIKEGGEIVRQAPSYAQLLHRLIGRLEQLAHVTGGRAPFTADERAQLLAAAQDVRLTDAALRWSEIARRSARTHSQMHFGGLLGRLGFAGELDSTLPWLLAGQHVQIGGKSAFGFGAYRIVGSDAAGGPAGAAGT